MRSNCFLSLFKTINYLIHAIYHIICKLYISLCILVFSDTCKINVWINLKQVTLISIKHTVIFSLARSLKVVNCCDIKLVEMLGIPSNGLASWASMGCQNCQPLIFLKLEHLRDHKISPIHWIVNNYSPKWRWLAVDIYQAAKW